MLLAVLGTGVFLAGLELMVTAVALPAIILDMGRRSAGLELRHASWIVNAYLLVYVATMPLAGRLADLWGSRRLFLVALVAFTLGSLAAGAAQTLDQLIAGRVIQALGGGALVPVATAAASHLFAGHARPRALGLIGALTFLGMAAGPFLGAAILAGVRPEGALAAAGLAHSPVADFISPAWRWVFYVNVPIGIVGLAFGWAATAGWDTPRTGARVDLAGAALFTIGLGTILLGVTLLGEQGGGATSGGLDPAVTSALLVVGGIAALALAVVHGLRSPEPFLDPRLFRDRVFSSAALVSLLTGYAFATAIVGTAVFVDRVMYGGPAGQRLALGSLAGATALGALASGLLVRRFSLRAVTAAGLAASIAGLAWMGTWSASVRDTGRRARRRPVRPWLRPDRHAALHGRGGGGGPAVLRRRLGDGHGRPNGRDGGRAGRPHRLRFDGDRSPVRPGVRLAGRIPGGAPGRSCRTGRSATRSSSTRWRRGRPARRRRRWSDSSSSRLA